jgi:hypothetical protein
MYVNNKTKAEEKSSVAEVRQWYNRTELQQASTHLVQASNMIVPTRKVFINAAAELSFKTIKRYDTKLPSTHVTKPTSFKKARNSPHPQWFQAELKEKKTEC